MKFSKDLINDLSLIIISERVPLVRNSITVTYRVFQHSVLGFLTGPYLSLSCNWVQGGADQKPRAKKHTELTFLFFALHIQTYPELKLGFIFLFFIFVSAKYKPNTRNQKDFKVFSLFLIFKYSIQKPLREEDQYFQIHSNNLMMKNPLRSISILYQTSSIYFFFFFSYFFYF